MNCKTIQAQLSAYLDEELSGREMLDVRDHLSRCSECAEEFHSIDGLKRVLCQSPIPAPSSGFEDRLVSRVLTATMPERHTKGISLLALTAIAAASMGGTLLLLNSMRQSAAPVSERDNIPFEIVQRDRAFSASSEPLLGSPVMMPVSNGR